jgi:hypothetical protein
MFHAGRKVLQLAAVAAVAAAGLVMTAGAVSAAGPDPGVDPPQTRDLMLAAIEGGAPMAETRGPAVEQIGTVKNAKTRTVSWTQTGVGSSISQDGSLMIVAAVKNSLDGDGAVVSTVTLNGTSGTDTATRYQANGVQKFEESFTLGAADANGLTPYSGSGKCTGPGTGVHKHEQCSYTFTGTLNPTTQVLNFNITGTTTR